jgi:hypothetical protein
LSEEPEVVVWARPILERIDKRERYKRLLNIVAGALALLLLASLGVLTYLRVSLFYPLVSQVLFGCLIFILVIYVIVDTFIVPPVTATPPQAYSLHLLRIVDRSHRGLLQDLDDSVAKLVRRIDSDLRRLEDDISASRTVKVLKMLRTLVLKYATASRQASHEAEPVKRITSTLHTAASMFYRFEDVEGLDVFMDADLRSEDIKDISERTSIISPMRRFRKLVQLPFPAQMAALFVGASVIGYIFYLFNPFLVSIVVIALAIILNYRRELGEWFRSKLPE